MMNNELQQVEGLELDVMTRENVVVVGVVKSG